MKFLIRLIEKIGTWYRSKLHQYDCEEQELVAVEVTQNISRADKSLQRKALAAELRHAGALYHLACCSWLALHPDKDIADFDALSMNEKEIYMKNVAHA